MLAEGGKDARGRVRITTVLVEPLERGEDEHDRAGGRPTRAHPADEPGDGAPRPPTSNGTATTRGARAAGRRAMSDQGDLDPEDAKIVTLARSARARTGAAEGAAVRDTDGRTYAAATVALPSLAAHGAAGRGGGGRVERGARPGGRGRGHRGGRAGRRVARRRPRPGGHRPVLRADASGAVVAVVDVTSHSPETSS